MELMKKKIINTLLAVTLSVTAFFIGRMTADQTEQSHIDRMEYAIDNVEYWELSEENTVLLYDYNGNVYEWK